MRSMADVLIMADMRSITAIVFNVTGHQPRTKTKCSRQAFWNVKIGFVNTTVQDGNLNSGTVVRVYPSSESVQDCFIVPGKPIFNPSEQSAMSISLLRSCHLQHILLITVHMQRM